MARLIAGMGTSHVPGVGAAMDNGKTHENYWVELFKGFEPIRAWHAKNVPDVNIIVFNDHAPSMSLNHYSTFMMGVAEQFQPADEGWGPRKVPVVEGHPELAWHLVENLILDEFDMAVTADFDVDHGLTVPLSIAYDQPDAWPAKVIPLCVNVIQYPQPTALRCFKLGQAIGSSGQPIGVLRAWPGGLAVTRGVGDSDCGDMVSPSPAFTTLPLPAAGGAVAVCSDGVWDALSSAEVSRILLDVSRPRTLVSEPSSGLSSAARAVAEPPRPTAVVPPEVQAPV